MKATSDLSPEMTPFLTLFFPENKQEWGFHSQKRTGWKTWSIKLYLLICSPAMNEDGIMFNFKEQYSEKKVLTHSIQLQIVRDRDLENHYLASFLSSGTQITILKMRKNKYYFKNHICRGQSFTIVFFLHLEVHALTQSFVGFWFRFLGYQINFIQVAKSYTSALLEVTMHYLR